MNSVVRTSKQTNKICYLLENDLPVYLTIFVYPSIHLCIYLPLPSNEVEVYQLPDSVMAIHGGQNAPGQP